MSTRNLPRPTQANNLDSANAATFLLLAIGLALLLPGAIVGCVVEYLLWMLLVDDGRVLVVADANRFSSPSARGDLRAINAAAAVAGTPTQSSATIAGTFPRDMVLEPDDMTLLVANYGPAQLQAVDATALGHSVGL